MWSPARSKGINHWQHPFRGLSVQVDKIEKTGVGQPEDNSPDPPDSLSDLSKDWQAVLIGCSAYKVATPLMFCDNDVLLVENVLHHVVGIPRDQIAILVDQNAPDRRPTRKGITAALTKLAHGAMPASANRNLLVYFSGHGFVEQGKGMLRVLGEPGEAGDDAISLEWLRETLNAIQPRRAFLIIDACHAGAEKNTTASSAMTKEFEADLTDPKIITFASCQSDQSSWGGWFETALNRQEQHSVFTWFFAQGLRGHADQSGAGTSGNGDHKIEIRELRDYTYDRVSKWVWAKYKQDQAPKLFEPPKHLFFLADLVRIAPPLASAIDKLIEESLVYYEPVWVSGASPQAVVQRVSDLAWRRIKIGDTVGGTRTYETLSRWLLLIAPGTNGRTAAMRQLLESRLQSGDIAGEAMENFARDLIAAGRESIKKVTTLTHKSDETLHLAAMLHSMSLGDELAIAADEAVRLVEQESNVKNREIGIRAVIKSYAIWGMYAKAAALAEGLSQQHKNFAFQSIAETQAKNGDFAEAEDTVQKIPDKPYQIRALNTIGALELASGSGRARETLDRAARVANEARSRNDTNFNAMIFECVEAQLKAGNVVVALRLAGEITGDSENDRVARAAAVHAIARHQAQIRRDPLAAKLTIGRAPEVTIIGAVAEAWDAVALSYMQAGAWEDALLATSSLRDPAARVKSYLELALVATDQVHAGELVRKAKETLPRCFDVGKCVAECARAELRLGRIEDALKTIGAVNNSRDYPDVDSESDVLIEAAEAYGRAGNLNEGRRIVERLSGGQNRANATIALCRGIVDRAAAGETVLAPSIAGLELNEPDLGEVEKAIAERWSAVTSLSAKGEDRSFELRKDTKGDLVRMEGIVRQGGTEYKMLRLLNHEGHFQVMEPPNGQVKAAKLSARQTLDWANQGLQQIQLMRRFGNLVLKGDLQVDGEDCWVISGPPMINPLERDVYSEQWNFFRKKDGFLVRVELIDRQSGTHSPVTYYREVATNVMIDEVRFKFVPSAEMEFVDQTHTPK